MRLGGAERRGAHKSQSGDFSGESFRYCNVTTQPGGPGVLRRNSEDAPISILILILLMPLPFIQLCMLDKIPVAALKSDTVRL